MVENRNYASFTVRNSQKISLSSWENGELSLSPVCSGGEQKFEVVERSFVFRQYSLAVWPCHLNLLRDSMHLHICHKY